MADEKTTVGSGDASSAKEGEARIIEETVVKPSPTRASDSTPQAAAAPHPGQAVSLIPPLPKPPEPSPPLPRDIPPPPPAKFVEQPAPEAPQAAAVAPPAPRTSAATPLASPLPVPPLPIPPAPSTTPEAIAPQAAPMHTPEEFAKEQETIAKILREAKLPERRPQAVESSPQKKEMTFDTTLGAASSLQPRVEETPGSSIPASPTPPPAEAAPAKQGESLTATIVSPLRTLKNDLQKVVRLRKMSLVRAVALEQEKRRGAESEAREEVSARQSRRTVGILFSATLLLLLGAVAFFGVFFVMGQRSGAPPENLQSAILFSESSVPFPLEGSALDLKRLLANARLSGAGTLGAITRIVPIIAETSGEGVVIERPATLQEFLGALGTRVPEELVRALSGDFFFGIHTVDENAPLFVIPVASYERAFAGMLRWEDTLNADLAPTFTPLPDQVAGSGGLPEKRRFEDAIMRNYDVRILKDDKNAIELYYSFPTRELLIIAESPYSFTEILSRLRAERKL